ncbi:glycosyltransferase [Aurantivibrio infirmus]
MIKVLHLRSSNSFLGAERVVIELSKRLPSLGYEPIVGVPMDEGDEIPELYTVAQGLGFQAELFRGKGPYDFSVIGKVRDYVKREGIGIVHSHGYREDLYAIGSRKYSALLATNHLWKRTDWKLKLYAFLDGHLLKRFDSVVAVSQPIVDDMLAAKISAKKITLIPNGIETERYTDIGSENLNLRSEFNIDKSKVLMVTVSSLTGEKGITYAISALAAALNSNPNLHLLIVGTGEENDALQQQARTLEVEKNISFAGRRNDIDKILKSSDIFLLPSLNEGLPMAMLEAMAAGKAVIATDVGDVAQALANEAGIIIPSQDVDALTKNILLLSGNPELIQRYGDKAQSIVVEKYSAQKMAQEYAKQYQQIARSKNL